MNERIEATADARRVIEDLPLFMDTETTGLGEDAEIVEIGIINEWGAVLFQSLIKPVRPIPSEATAIHGISNDDVANEPTWDEVHDHVNNMIRGRTVVIYNADYDVRLMEQTAKLYERTVSEYKPWCAMLAYAKYYGEWDDARASWKWQRLTNAARQTEIKLPDRSQAHRAIYDCLMTLGVVRAMADLPDDEPMTYVSDQMSKPQDLEDSDWQEG